MKKFVLFPLIVAVFFSLVLPILYFGGLLDFLFSPPATKPTSIIETNAEERGGQYNKELEFTDKDQTREPSDKAPKPLFSLNSIPKFFLPETLNSSVTALYELAEQIHPREKDPYEKQADYEIYLKNFESKTVINGHNIGSYFILTTPDLSYDAERERFYHIINSYRFHESKYEETKFSGVGQNAFGVEKVITSSDSEVWDVDIPYEESSRVYNLQKFDTPEEYDEKAHLIMHLPPKEAKILAPDLLVAYLVKLIPPYSRNDFHCKTPTLYDPDSSCTSSHTSMVKIESVHFVNKATGEILTSVHIPEGKEDTP